jgi:hypothetical protein
MSPVVAVPVLWRRVGVSANVAGVCVLPVVCVSCVLCRTCGWLSGQTYMLTGSLYRLSLLTTKREQSKSVSSKQQPRKVSLTYINEGRYSR